MKVIRGLDSATQGLVDYKSQEPQEPTYPRFRNYDSGNAYRELLTVLIDTQHGLCGYCEVKLVGPDRQVEHFVPQDAGEEGRRKAVDYSNMIACCLGGDQAGLFEKDTERYISPTKDSISCGAAKQDITDPRLIDPRTLAASPSPFRVQADGKMVPDPKACAYLGLPEPSVWRTIEILGLNVRRLKANRTEIWDLVQENYGGTLNNTATAELAAQVELLPGTGNDIPKYFTTIRSFFGTAAETVLMRDTQAWI